MWRAFNITVMILWVCSMQIMDHVLVCSAFPPSSSSVLEDGSAQPYLEALAGPDGSWTQPNTCCYMSSHFIPETVMQQEEVWEVLVEGLARATHDWSRALVIRPTYKSESAASSFGGGHLLVLVYALWCREASMGSAHEEVGV